MDGKERKSDELLFYFQNVMNYILLSIKTANLFSEPKNMRRGAKRLFTVVGVNIETLLG